jgi:HSP20 family protein
MQQEVLTEATSKKETAMTNALTERRSTNGAMTEQRSTLNYTPRFDIWEDDQAYHLEGDLPGVTAEQLDIRYENQELRIWGKVPPRQKDVEYWSQEFGIGDFYRSFSVGEGIDGDRIEATMKDGVLSLTLPKHPSVMPRRIEVKAG